MKFNRRARLDTSQISDRRGMGRGGTVAAGGGIGALVILLLALCTGGDPSSLIQVSEPAVQVQPGEIDTLETQCQTGADLEQNADCRFVVYVNSIQDYWEDEFARRGATYSPANTTFFTSATQTGCGGASSQVGPFYCPADHTVYLDLGFFEEIRTRFGGTGGDFAEAYVLAHEYGHHVQNLTGQLQQVRPGSGPSSDAVRLELQADCYAGVWARHATTTDTAEGEPLITEITEEDLQEGLNAAAIVGDDYIQERFQGTVSPESWTHGSSEQRQRWFATGYQSGDLGTCNTFSTNQL
ncbi:MAG TPA: neutral zinc metallopeptidase [Jiangellaceae bacterium]|nr:neutral zinc metallopeptidase [Jiangellaceae bacterium]